MDRTTDPSLDRPDSRAAILLRYLLICLFGWAIAVLACSPFVELGPRFLFLRAPLLLVQLFLDSNAQATPGDTLLASLPATLTLALVVISVLSRRLVLLTTFVLLLYWALNLMMVALAV